MKKKNKKVALENKSKQKAEQAAREQKILQLTQKEASIISNKIKAEGASDGLDAAIAHLTDRVPKLFRDKVVLQSIKTVVKSAEAIGGENAVIEAVGIFVLQKIVLYLSDASGDLGKQAKMLSGSLSLVQLEKASLSGG